MASKNAGQETKQPFKRELESGGQPGRARRQAAVRSQKYFEESSSAIYDSEAESRSLPRYKKHGGA